MKGFFHSTYCMKCMISISILIAAISIVRAQQTLPDSLQIQFLLQHSPVEKLYAATDKSFYVSGETIWFKIYNLEGGTNLPLTLSSIAYVEVLSEDNKPVLQGKIDLREGMGTGSFIVPNSINSGKYVLRAYTNLMRNYDPAFYFHKKITIVNPFKTSGNSATNDSAGYNIDFFAEGGEMVAGVKSKVGFEVINKYGEGIDCQGYILNKHNDTIANFRTLKFGLGSFEFIPVQDEVYKAVVAFKHGVAVTKELPPAKTNGVVMHLDDDDPKFIKVEVIAAKTSDVAQTYLLVHQRSVVKTVLANIMEDGKTTFLIDKQTLNDGVSAITIFDNERRPVCERLYFKPPSQANKLLIAKNKDEFSTREKVIIHLTDSTPANANISVYLIDSLQKTSKTDISSYLWLTSELKGRIENPSYYLSDTAAIVNEAIENLLLTHGWRKVDQRISAPAFSFLPEYEGHMVKATIMDNRSNSGAENVDAYCTVPGEKFRFSTAVSNEAGEALFNVRKFYGANELIIQTKKGEGYTISVSNPFSESYASFNAGSFVLPEYLQKQLLQHSISSQVQNSYNKEEFQRFLLPYFYDSTAFYGIPDKKYFLDDYTRFVTMEEVMREYVPEVHLRKQRDNFHYYVADNPHKFYFDEDPLVLLDGAPVFDVNKIISFDPLKVKKMEIVTHKQFYSGSQYSGIVSYTTYKGNLGGFQLEPNAIVVPYEGLQFEREFYSPVYESTEQKESRIADYRNVLYWSPNVIINGSDTSSFYTSDIPGKYAVAVEGIDKNGLPINAVTYITVKKEK